MKTFLMSMLFAAGVLSAQNLVMDPEFDKGRIGLDCQISGHKGTMDAKIITEDATWNKCLKVTLVKHHVDPKTGKKNDYVACWIGQENKRTGFTAKPNTVYEFQFEFKGTIVPTVAVTEWTGPSFWGNMKDYKVSLEKKLVPTDQWTVVKGTFQTTPKVKTAALLLKLTSREEWNNLYPEGGYYMIDKVVIREKSSLLPATRSAAKPETEKKK